MAKRTLRSVVHALGGARCAAPSVAAPVDTHGAVARLARQFVKADHFAPFFVLASGGAGSEQANG